MTQRGRTGRPGEEDAGSLGAGEGAHGNANGRLFVVRLLGRDGASLSDSGGERRAAWVQEQAVEASVRTIVPRAGLFMAAWEAAKLCQRTSELGWFTNSAEPVEAGHRFWSRFFRWCVRSGIPSAENSARFGVNLRMPSGSGIGGSCRRLGRASRQRMAAEFQG